MKCLKWRASGQLTKGYPYCTDNSSEVFLLHKLFIYQRCENTWIIISNETWEKLQLLNLISHFTNFLNVTQRVPNCSDNFSYSFQDENHFVLQINWTLCKMCILLVFIFVNLWEKCKLLTIELSTFSITLHTECIICPVISSYSF